MQLVQVRAEFAFLVTKKATFSHKLAIYKSLIQEARTGALKLPGAHSEFVPFTLDAAGTPQVAVRCHQNDSPFLRLFTVLTLTGKVGNEMRVLESKQKFRWGKNCFQPL